MKLQHLAIIFVIIMLPISIVITSYIQAQIDTISLQTLYSSQLQTATYDAIKSFQLNTINNKYSTVSDSKIRDIEASISTFYNSLGTELGASGYNREALEQFIPAIVYTLYDGYYIYGEYYNDTIQDYQHGLRPYIYYSCRYVNDNSDFVVNYTLDNTITIYGTVKGEYVTKSGALIKLDSIKNIVSDTWSYTDNVGNVHTNDIFISVEYDGITIGKEILKEQLMTVDNPTSPEIYEYTMYNNKKIYKDNVRDENNNIRYFWNHQNEKQIITDPETLGFVNKMTEGGHLYSNSAAQYYAEAYYFSDWVNENLDNINQTHAVNSNGEKITDFAIDTETDKIFDLEEDKNNPLISSSTFNQNRISVIRKSIESNLSAAIANFGWMSTYEYEFVMPKFTEEDWDRLVNNISVATFMQGLPIGAKYFNNYCIITNDKNKEVVTNDSIYVITDDNQVHLSTCKEMIDNNKKVKEAYRNTDFERQTMVITENDERYFYPHVNDKCYSCMVSIAETYDIDELIAGRIMKYNNDEDIYEEDDSKDITSLRKMYLTALARERYDLYKTNAYFGIN